MSHRTTRIGFCAGLLLALLMPSTADAGSVFLKNGYIIQGKIVERGDGVVVLGWQNGQVTIHDRFIDEVLLDPSEEELIRRQQALAEIEAADPDGPRNVPLPSEPVISLPDSYDTIIGRDRTGTNIDPPGNGGVTVLDPVDPNGTGVVNPGNGGTSGGETGVGEVPRPEFSEKIFPSLNLGIEVSSEWAFDEQPNSLRFQHVSDPDRIHLTINFWRGEGVNSDDAIAALGASLRTHYPNFEITAGEDRSIAAKAAKTLVLSDSSQQIQCLQQVITNDSGVFVFGSFLPGDTDPETVSSLENLIASIRFLSE